MTDEQWLWVYTNMALDNDEKLEGMCTKCRDEFVSDNRCTRCGKIIEEQSMNPNFDKSKFEELSRESDGGVNQNFDKEAYERLDKDGEAGGE